MPEQFVHELMWLLHSGRWWLATIAVMTSHTQGEDDLLLERQFCFALAVASRTVIGAYKPVLQDLGLTHPQYLVMLALWEKSPRTVKELGEELLLSPATLSPLLKRLGTAGYVTRRRNEGDERSLAIELTPEGAALRSRALDVPATMLRKLGLTRAEATQLHAGMDRLIRAAQNDRSEANEPPDAGGAEGGDHHP